ncbi:hypothetical protein [Micromonospora sp. NPDC005205]|uniref:hypothetical protein n=1 Tax=Micromonospora sp. NPDC005205 TaxID=3156714 RepID=UPI0033AD335F
MDVTADDRLRSVVLFGAAAAALFVGGWWWHSAAPSSTPGAAASPTATPSAERSVSTPLERLIAAEEPEARITARMDPDTGEVIRVESSPRAVIDLDTGSIVDIEGDPALLFPSGDLPSFNETIWREERELAPGQGLTRQASDSGARYLLQYRCTRPGALVLTSTGADVVGQLRIDCDGAIANAEVLPGSGPFRLSLSAGDRPIDIQAQLVALPSR